MCNSVKQTEGRGSPEQDVDSKHQEVVAEPPDLAVVSEEVKVGDPENLNEEGECGGEDDVQRAVVDQVSHRGVTDRGYFKIQLWESI